MLLMRHFHLFTCSQRLHPHRIMRAWRKRMLILKEAGPLAAQPYPRSGMEPKICLRRTRKAMPAAKIVKESKCGILQRKALLRGFWLFNIMLEAVEMAAIKAGWRKDFKEDKAVDTDLEETMDVEMEEVEEEEEEMWIDPPPLEQRCGDWLRGDESEEGEEDDEYLDDDEDEEEYEDEGDEDEDAEDEDDEDEDDDDEGYESEDFEDMYGEEEDEEDEDDDDEDDEDDDDYDEDEAFEDDDEDSEEEDDEDEADEYEDEEEDEEDV